MKKQARIGVAVGVAVLSALVASWVTPTRVDRVEPGSTGPADARVSRAHGTTAAKSQPRDAGAASNTDDAKADGVPAEKAPFDVAAVIERVRRAFEPTEDGSLRGWTIAAAVTNSLRLA